MRRGTEIDSLTCFFQVLCLGLGLQKSRNQIDVVVCLPRAQEEELWLWYRVVDCAVLFLWQVMRLTSVVLNLEQVVPSL